MKSALRPVGESSEGSAQLEPLGNDPAGLTVIEQLAGEDVWLAVSVTVPLKDEAPVPVGVPVTAPVLVFSDSPVGNDPLLIAYVTYGAVPPLAVNVEL